MGDEATQGDRHPFVDVIIEKRPQVQHREKQFHDHEIATILRAASSITDTNNPGMAMRRWVPWILGYTGARAGEITQLRGQDVRQVDDIWCLDLTPRAGTVKTGKARLVPIHEHLIEQGFLEFAEGRTGPLFYRPRKKQLDPTDLLNQKKAPAVQAREQLGIWIRKIGIDDLDLSPNHAWRHTFKREATRAGIDAGIRDAICGHSPRTVADIYETPNLDDMAEALKVCRLCAHR